MQHELNVHLRQATEADAEPITEIYNYWVAASSATFDTKAIAPAQMRERLSDVRLPCWVAEHGPNNAIIGYARGGFFRPFAGSAHVAETAIYLHEGMRGHGIGRNLYQCLLEQLPHFGFEVAVACITKPNPASECLHASLGFKEQGVLPDLGRKNNRSFAVSFWSWHALQQ